MRTLKCIQLNCHKSKAAVANLRNELMCDIDVGLIQEPHTYDNDVKGLAGFQVLHAGDADHRPRAAIIAKQHVNIWFDRRFSDADTVVGIVKYGDKQIFIASVYLDIQLNAVISNSMERLVSYCKMNNLELILGVDSNAHSVLYGDETNPRGEILEEFITVNGLEVSNMGRAPTFVARGTSTVIDVTLTLHTHCLLYTSDAADE